MHTPIMDNIVFVHILEPLADYLTGLKYFSRVPAAGACNEIGILISRYLC